MRRPLAALAILFALGLAHEALVLALDRAELVEQLLAPGWDALVALPAAALLYVVRLALVFFGPGVAVVALAMIARARLRARTPERGR